MNIHISQESYLHRSIVTSRDTCHRIRPVTWLFERLRENVAVSFNKVNSEYVPPMQDGVAGAAMIDSRVGHRGEQPYSRVDGALERSGLQACCCRQVEGFCRTAINGQGA